MKTKIIITLAALLMTAAFSGCSAQIKEDREIKEPGKQEENVQTGEKDEIPGSGEEDKDTSMEDNIGVNTEITDGESFSKAVNIFNWKYFDIQDHESNLFYSPMSLSSALSMALYGAGGNTEEELKKVLNISDTDTFLSDINAFSKTDYGENTKLSIANSLWMDKEYTEKFGLNEDFVTGLKTKLDAEAKEVDFANDSEGACKEISDWVNKKTEGFISDYSPVADSTTVLDIINAIYFNGKWESEFMKEDTFDEEFKGKETSVVDMMHMYDYYFKYLEKDGFKAVELPYKESSLVMDIIMPVEEGAVDAGKRWTGFSVEEREEFLKELSEASTEELMVLAIPKFDMDLTAENLKENLQKMGIKDAFDPESADFSKITQNMYISDIAHRAKIEVDEEGTKAAAVTEIEMAVTAAGPMTEAYDFICDKPYVYVIKDTKTGVILFCGLVNSL